MHGELGVLGQMGHDHSADRVCVDQAGVEDEGDQVVVQDDRLEVEVHGDMSGSDEEGS